MKLSECARLLDGKLQGDDVEFASITVSNLGVPIQPKSLVVPADGQKITKHYLSQLIKAQAAAVALQSSSQKRIPKTSLPIIVTPDLATGLLRFAAVWREEFPIPVICVAGSSGKTTTTALLGHLLSKRYRILCSPVPEKSYNTVRTLPWILLGLTSHHQIAVVEVETEGKQYMDLLALIANPQISIITNVQIESWDGEYPVEKLAREKGEVFRRLTTHGVGIINNDDVFAKNWRRCLGKRASVSFAIKNNADVTAKNIKLDEIGYPSFDLCVANETAKIKLNLLGQHNIYNALAAAAAAMIMAIPFAEVQEGLNSFQPVKWRLQRYMINSTTIIDDSFNTNPPAVFAAIEVLGRQQGQKILVIADMVETAKKSAITYHKTIGITAKEAGIDKLYGFGPMCQFTAAAFGANGYWTEDLESLKEMLTIAISSHTTVLFKGKRFCGAFIQELIVFLQKNQ